MAVQITDVRMGASGKSHEAITHYLWFNDADGSTNWADKVSMVEWVRSGNQAWVAGPVQSAWVQVIANPFGQDYLRTVADGTPTDNLLSLPGAQ